MLLTKGLPLTISIQRKFKYWTTNDGAPADPGLMSPAVINGNFWVSTSSKLYKVNAADFESVVYDYRDGLPTSFLRVTICITTPLVKRCIYRMVNTWFIFQ